MSNNIKVVEKTVNIPYIVDSFEILINGLGLNKFVCCLVNTYDKDHNFLYSKQIMVEGVEYENWGNNDDYLKQLIANKLDLVIQQ